MNALSLDTSMLASRIFGPEAQIRFAALSGDLNPLHLDPVAARRTLAGAPIVHGIHILLWLLDSVASRHTTLAAMGGLKVQFRKVVYWGDRVDAELTELTQETLRTRVSVDGVEVLRMVARLGPGRPAPAVLDPAEMRLMPRQILPCEPRLEQMEGMSGRLPFAAEGASLDALFPGAARLIGSSRIAALACSTYLVGMVVPGLHSIYAALDLDLSCGDTGRRELAFAVASLDRRVRRILIDITGGGLTGSLQTFSRLPPVRQASMGAAASLIRAGEFDSTSALIIGGSRGLGEVAAKLIAAGGGRALITYVSGAADAQDVAAQIKDSGGQCAAAVYDVRLDAYLQLRQLVELPRNIYYFATPPIARLKGGLFAPARLHEFNEFYVYGFFRLVEAARRLRPEGICVFYPSSEYVEKRPAAMTEYAMSKAAGEVLCADIARFMPDVRIVARRLPRMPTDQTASLIQAKNANPLEVILPIVRDMQRPIP